MLSDRTLQAARARLEILRGESERDHSPMAALRVADQIYFAQLEDRYAEAIALYERHLDAALDGGRRWLRLGKLQAKAKAVRAAADAAAAHLSLYPGDGAVWLFAAGLHWRLNEYDDARRCLEHCLLTDPSNAKAQTGIAGLDHLGNAVTRLNLEWSGRSFCFRFPCHDFEVDTLRLSGRFANEDALEAIAERAPVGGCCLELGAGEGNDAVFILRVLRPSSLLLIETDPSSAALCRDNLSLNLSESHCNVAFLSLSNQDKELTIDQAVLCPIDFIKCNDATVTLSVLKGAQSQVERARPWIGVSVNRADSEQVFQWLRERRYEICWRSDASNGSRLLARPEGASDGGFAGDHYAVLAEADHLLERSEFDRAVSILEALAARWPQWALAVLSLAVALLQRKQSKGDDADIVRAYAVLTDLVAAQPREAEAWRLLGRIACQASLQDQARQHFMNVRALLPDDQEAREALEL